MLDGSLLVEGVGRGCPKPTPVHSYVGFLDARSELLIGQSFLPLTRWLWPDRGCLESTAGLGLSRDFTRLLPRAVLGILRAVGAPGGSGPRVPAEAGRVPGGPTSA